MWHFNKKLENYCEVEEKLYKDFIFSYGVDFYSASLGYNSYRVLLYQLLESSFYPREWSRVVFANMTLLYKTAQAQSEWMETTGEESLYSF